MFTWANALPLVMMAQSAIASLVYLSDGDWRKAGYWISAAVITFFVTV